MYQSSSNDNSWGDNGNETEISQITSVFDVQPNSNGIIINGRQRSQEIPRRGFVLKASIAINAMAICGGLITMLCQTLSILTRIQFLIIAPLDLIYQCYGILFSVLIILLEVDMPEAIRSTMLLQSLSIRGSFYIFLGIFVIETHLQHFPTNSY